MRHAVSARLDERVTNHIESKCLDEDDAKKLVCHMFSGYWKALANIFDNAILWSHAISKEHLYLSVKATVSDGKPLETYDDEEVWKSTIKECMFLFDRILQYYPAELCEIEDDDVWAEEE